MKAVDRLYEYLNIKGLKPTAIEKAIGISNGYLSAQKKRQADIGEGMMNKIIDYCRDINPEWLLTGNGEMLRNNTCPNSENKQDNTTPSDPSMALLMLIREKDNIIREQAEEIGSLKEQLKRIEYEFKKHVSDVSSSAIVSVG